MLLRQARAEALGAASPGRIDPRARWDELRPVRRLDPAERTGLPALEIVSVCRSGAPGLVHDHGHAFVRLIDAEGGVCPVGFFPDESTAIEPNDVPGLRMPGMLLLPDKYDRVGWHPLVTRVPLDASGHARVKHHLEALQRGRAEGTLDFDILDRSCVGFVVRVAALAGVRVAAECSLLDFLDAARRPRLARLARRAAGVLPAGLRAIAFNLGVACRGGFCAYSRQWTLGPAGEPALERVAGIRPLFAGWTDLARRRVPFHHVRALRDWQRRAAAEGLDRYRSGAA